MNLGGDSNFPTDDEATWPDLYALLGVAPDASFEQLRARIRTAYLEATTNADHRNVERRIYFQMMGQRIVPQARRILLEERTRRAYDRQLALHRNGDASAISYTRFVSQLATLENEKSAPANDIKSALLASADSPSVLTTLASPQNRPSSTRSASPKEAAQQLFDQAHDVLRSEKKFAEMTPLNALLPSLADEAAVADAPPIELPPAKSRRGTRQNDVSIPNSNVSESKSAPEKSATVSETPTSESSFAVATLSGLSLSDVSTDQTEETPRENVGLWEKVAPRNVRTTETAPNPKTDAPPQTDALSQTDATRQTDSPPQTDATRQTDVFVEKPSLSRTRDAKTAQSSTRLAKEGNFGDVPILQRVLPAENISPTDEMSPDAMSPDEIAARKTLKNAATTNAPNRAATAANATSSNATEANADLADAFFDDTVFSEANSTAANRATSANATLSNADLANANNSGEATSESDAQIEAEAGRARVLRVERGARPLTSEQLRSSGGQDLGGGFRGLVSSGRAPLDENAPSKSGKRFQSRVSVGNRSGARDQAASGGRKRVLSQPILLLLTAFTSAALAFMTFHLRNASAPTVVAPTVRIVYSSDLQPFMERARQNFAQTTQGRGVDLDLRPVDSRDGMHMALGDAAKSPLNAPSNAPSSTRLASDAASPQFDVWIPSETLWSDRFNQVASKNRRQPISVARSLADSPLVLIARDDRAASLKKRFPNHIISSWDALRRAIAADAPGHFGLTDPQKSGSGVLARLFMAREWCERNGVPWNEKAASDARLWKWLATFEDNVPQYSALTSDMIKDLVMGNSDRFWWAIGYESDALGWMNSGKSLQIFYLPRTAYAGHPFCVLERADIDADSRRARNDFETFLRSRAMQNALAQNGFRPTEIRLADLKKNPFARADFRARGLKESGFRVDQRVNYDVLNALNVQWSTRYK